MLIYSLALFWSISTLPLVVLDPGHGGSQLGAIGVCGVQEKDITLDVALRVQQVLEASKRLRVRLSRDDDRDLSLRERVEMANGQRAEVFVSIHANASTNVSVSGTETFLSKAHSKALDPRLRALVAREEASFSKPESAKDDILGTLLGDLRLDGVQHESQTLAQGIQSAVSKVVGRSARGVEQAPFFVLREAQMPAILLELGFLTHPKECRLLSSDAGQKKIAIAIAEGIVLHLRRQRLMLSRSH